jgi:hypothetical protein
MPYFCFLIAAYETDTGQIRDDRKCFLSHFRCCGFIVVSNIGIVSRRSDALHILMFFEILRMTDKCAILCSFIEMCFAWKILFNGKHIEKLTICTLILNILL